MKFSIVIATYNRAAELTETLASLSRLTTPLPWEVIVVDNNSPDDTRSVVERAAIAFPVPLTYGVEKEQGRRAGLKRRCALASGCAVVTTDDGVRVERDWLDRIERGLTELG